MVSEQVNLIHEMRPYGKIVKKFYSKSLHPSKSAQNRSDAGKGGYSTAGMQDRWDARSGGMQDRKDSGYDRRNTGQEDCRIGGMQDRRDAGQVSYRTGVMHQGFRIDGMKGVGNRTGGTEQEGCRTGGM